MLPGIKCSSQFEQVFHSILVFFLFVIRFVLVFVLICLQLVWYNVRHLVSMTVTGAAAASVVNMKKPPFFCDILEWVYIT